MTFLQNSRRRPHNHTSPFAGHASELSGFTCGVGRRFSDNNRQLLPTILEIENIGACEVNAVASSGVRVMRIGPFSSPAPFGTRITMYSLTPSRNRDHHIDGDKNISKARAQQLWPYLQHASLPQW